MSCRAKYRSEIINNAKRIIKADALSYKEGDNYIDIPFGVSRNIKDRAQALQVARRKATEVNEIYQQKVFGTTVFINHEQERAIRLLIAPSSLLIDAYEVKNGQREASTLFQLETKEESAPNKELNTKLTQILNQLGVTVTSLDAYKEYYKLKYGKDLDVNPNALADLFNKIIAVAQDKEKIDTLPEEVSHIILKTFDGSELLNKLLELVVNDPIYEQVKKEYSRLYNNDETKIREEALGKLLAQSFIKQYTESTKVESKLFSGLKRLIERFFNLFKKNKQLTNELDKIAKEILSGNANLEVNNIKDNTIKNGIIKEGVDFVFEQSPELFDIGTKQEYSQYLDTIFPDSKVRDIVYHGSFDKIEQFNKEKLKSGKGVGFYFSSDIKYSRDLLGAPFVNGHLINLINPDIGGYAADFLRPEDKINIESQGKDGVIAQSAFIEIPEYVAFEPEQIHILGSKSDIEGFKKWKKANLMYQLDSTKYTESTTLDNLKSKLEDVIKKRITRLKIYENKALSEYSKEEKVRVDKLLKLFNEDKITLGIVDFINDIDHDTESTWNRLKKVEGNALETAKVLREIKAYVIPFNDTLKDIRSELSLQEGNEEIINEITKITSKLDDLQRIYDKKVKLVLSQFLFPFAENNKSITSPEDLLKKLEEEKDISIVSRFLDSMAESTDDILGLFDRVAKEYKERARISANSKIRDLLLLDKKLKDSGIKNNDWMYEVSNGNISGNLVTEYNQGEFKDAKNKAWNTIKDKLKEAYNIDLPSDSIERDLLLSKNKEANRDYKAFWKNWFKENTQPNPKATQLIADKRAYFDSLYGKQTSKGKLKADIAFDDWLLNNTTETLNPYTGETTTYLKGELMLPADKYKNKVYTDIQSNSLKKQYYDTVVNIKKEQDKYLPDSIIDPYLAPQIRKDFLERAKGNITKAVKEEINDIKKLREDEDEFGLDIELVDTEDKPVNFLPVYYTRKIKDTNDLSLDITATMALYIQMSEDYKEMQKVVNVLELGEEVLANRKIVEGESALNKVFNKAGLNANKAYSRQRGGNSYERYKDWMEMVVYGKKKVNEKWLNVAGINTVKAIDMFNKYTSIQALGFNVYSAVNNTLLGNALARQEAFSKEFIGKGGLSFADKTYWSEMSKYLNGIGDPYSDSKLKLVGDLMDIMQDFTEKTREINTDRTKFGRLANTGALYVLNSAGEHQIQWRTALAVMDNIKLTDKDGKNINLWEALEVIDGKIHLKTDLKGPNGKEFTMDDVISAGLRIKALNQKLHGIYNDVDRSAIQKWTIGRMALMFRKWIKPGINRRFDPKRYDYSLDKEVEGMYVTSWNFLKKVKGDLRSVMTIYNELTPGEQANIRRTALELSYMIGAALLAAILEAQIDDEDDEKLLAFTAYQFNRMQTDLMFYVPVLGIREQVKIVKSPMAGIKTLQGAINMIDFTTYLNVLAPFNDEDFLKKYKSGKHKGDTKFYVKATNLVPVVENIRRLLAPEEQLKYFNTDF